MRVGLLPAAIYFSVNCISMVEDVLDFTLKSEMLKRGLNGIDGDRFMRDL